MKHTWRWIGPRNPIHPEDIAQAGAQALVSALHHVPNGEVWTRATITHRQREVALASDGTPSGLSWDVVDSLPVSENIKKQKGQWRTHIDAYKASMENLAAAGIQVICYNFMPVLDWARTDLRWRRRTGARADNDLPVMMERFGPKVHFLHLRNVRREQDGSFFEDEHLEGETDVVALIAAILREEARRRAEGRTDCDIPMRPDHGQEIADDLRRDGQPGYPLVGRLRGLAELRGVERALRVTGAFA